MQIALARTPSASSPSPNPHLRLIEGGLTFRNQLGAMAPRLLPRALKLTRDRDRASDLIQETCLRALRFEASFMPGTHFRAWLQQVMYSVFVSQCRRNKRERRVAAAFANDPNCAPSQPSELRHPVLLPGLKRALADLPAVYEHTLVLVDLEERSYQEAATTLGVPVGTVMSRLHRARRLLGEQLASGAA